MQCSFKANGEQVVQDIRNTQNRYITKQEQKEKDTKINE
jgi:hypothetical protein